jgi:4-aminobutyrate aminotransferase/(S)-3-amino-2-methylpropionate transaminase
LATHPVGAVLLEPILGRGGVRPLGPETLARIARATHDNGALLIADEIWTGLGRSGAMAWSVEQGVAPDLLCLGKGLGGGLPLSACLGSREVLGCWSRDAEVVHTSTHAGNPLAAACALATLDVIEEEALVRRAREFGNEWLWDLTERLGGLPVQVRGEGLMVAIELEGRPGSAARVMQLLLDEGYLVSTGGGARDTVILTPALTISNELLTAFAQIAPRVFEQALAP